MQSLNTLRGVINMNMLVLWLLACGDKESSTDTGTDTGVEVETDTGAETET